MNSLNLLNIAVSADEMRSAQRQSRKLLSKARQTHVPEDIKRAQEMLKLSKVLEEKFDNILSGVFYNEESPDVHSLFAKWAEVYFQTARFNVLLVKQDVYLNFQKETELLISRYAFGLQLKAWAKSKGYICNPEKMCKHGRIYIRYQGVISEGIYISTNKN